MNLKKLLPLASVMSVLGVVATTTPARASSVDCQITNVLWAAGTGGGELQIKCGGTWYYADTTTATCTAKGSDTTKAWLSMAEAALLSGKSTALNYTGTCLEYVRMH